MMKHTGALALGLGLFLGLPAFTFGGGLPDSVESALDETLRALDVLGDLRSELEADQPLPPGTIESVTEAPTGTAAGRDDHLVELRDEVSALQAQLDARRLREGVALQEPVGTDTPAATQASDTPGTVTDTGVDTRGVSTGLSRTFVRSLGGGSSDGVALGDTDPDAGQPTEPTDSTEPTGDAGNETTDPVADAADDRTPSPEGQGYSANPLRQAKACFRAGRYQQGVDILEGVAAFPEGDYWRAKCLDRLGRTEEAIVLWQAVAVDEDAGPVAALAERDAEFAAWRLEFEQQSGLTTGGSQ